MGSKIIRCHIRHGLQAAREQGCTVHVVLTNGLVVDDTLKEDRFFTRIQELKEVHGEQWKAEQWRKMYPHHFTNKIPIGPRPRKPQKPDK